MRRFMENKISSAGIASWSRKDPITDSQSVFDYLHKDRAQALAVTKEWQ